MARQQAARCVSADGLESRERDPNWVPLRSKVLTEAQQRAMYALYLQGRGTTRAFVGLTRLQLAKHFGVGPNLVSMVCSMKVRADWKAKRAAYLVSIRQPGSRDRQKQAALDQDWHPMPRSKVSQADQRRIYTDYVSSGMTHMDLARRHRVSAHTIAVIVDLKQRAKRAAETIYYRKLRRRRRKK